MRIGPMSRRIATLLLICASAIAIAPHAASASSCTQTGLISFTVGVAGNDVATTPAVFVGVCDDGYDPTTGIPSPRVEQYSGGTAVFLDQPPGSTPPSAYVNVDGTQHNIQVPPVPGGSSTCLVYCGYASSNPGGCLFYVEA